MARNDEKAQSMLNRFITMKNAEKKKPKERRPFLASECRDLADDDKWRQQIMREIGRKIAEIRSCFGLTPPKPSSAASTLASHRFDSSNLTRRETEMAKSKNHTAHNQSAKAHKNGIKKPKKTRNISTSCGFGSHPIAAAT